MKRLFMKEYERQLRRCVEMRPEDYSYPLAHIPAVLERMGNAIDRHSFSNRSPAIRATCKVLGIKSTYAAIIAFCSMPDTRSPRWVKENDPETIIEQRRANDDDEKRLAELERAAGCEDSEDSDAA
jgi:hypothetical protein